MVTDTGSAAFPQGSFSWNWGLDEPPHPSAAGELPPVDLLPEQLPEVVALTAQGWELAPDAPGWTLLPAIWPRSHRTWVPDRCIRWATVTCGDREPVQERLGDEDSASVECDYAVTAQHHGLPGRPAGRLWLLRPPSSWTLEGVLSILERAADRADADRGRRREDATRFTTVVAQELSRLFDSATTQRR